MSETLSANSPIPMPPPEPHASLERAFVLDPSECARAVADVLALRHLWIQRVNVAPFFTLGAASYLDADPNPEPYRELLKGYNPLLRLQFGWLLDRVSRAISESMGLETQWLESAALPGFHIYLADEIFFKSVAEIHFDRQYELVDWSSVSNPDFSTPLSFTMPIDLPKTGGGLNTWPVEEDELRRMQAAGVDPPMTFQPYALGELVMHSGNLLHQASLGRVMAEDERRITLQGHGVRSGNRMYLYW